MTMAERPSDRAIAEAVHEQQERGYYTGACDCILTRAGEIDALRINTHAADCYLWGVKHHECAVREIERLRTLDAAPSEPVVRFNRDGSLDEVVGVGEFHIEQMGPCHWWMQLGPHMVGLHARGKISANFGENEARDPSATSDPAINPPETDSKLIVPSAECWRMAMDDVLSFPSSDEEWADIEQRAREIAKEGK